MFTPGEWDENVYRTITITNLPLNINMKTLLKGVLGGEVYSVHLMNMEQCSGSHMGIVTFVNERAAMAYIKFAANYGVYYNDQRANVFLLQTATYPMSDQMETDIFKHGHTRCLSIRGPPDADRYRCIFAHIQRRLPMYFDLGDAMIDNETHTEVIVRLNSIPAAQDVHRSLESDHGLRTSEIDFAPDPCAQRLPGSKL
jgi:T-complex protein 1 subunit beta